MERLHAFPKPLTGKTRVLSAGAGSTRLVALWRRVGALRFRHSRH